MAPTLNEPLLRLKVREKVKLLPLEAMVVMAVPVKLGSRDSLSLNRTGVRRSALVPARVTTTALVVSELILSEVRVALLGVSSAIFCKT